MLVGKHQLLTKSFFLELRGQKSGYLGWLSAGNLELQVVGKIQGLTNWKIRRSGILQPLRTVFRKYLGLKLARFLGRTPSFSAACGRQVPATKHSRPSLEVEIHIFTLHMMQRYSS